MDSGIDDDRSGKVINFEPQKKSPTLVTKLNIVVNGRKKPKPWTTAEDAEFLKAIAKHGCRWAAVREEMGSERWIISLSSRWQIHVKSILGKR